MFEPAGELHLAFHGHEDYTNYYRELDIEKAVDKNFLSRLVVLLIPGKHWLLFPTV